MNGIFDVIKKKSENLGIEVVSYKPMTIDEGKWYRCKKFVDNLPSKYNLIWENADRDGWEMLKHNSHFYDKNKKRTVKTYITELIKRVEGHRVIVEIVGNEDKAIQKVNYYAFDNLMINVYQRIII